MEPLRALDVIVFVDGVAVQGALSRPVRAEGLVLSVAWNRTERAQLEHHACTHMLHCAGLATLALDLWSDRPLDLPVASHRLQIATNWAETHALTRNLPLAYLGTGEGAAAALHAAGTAFNQVRAMVTVGGRIDLVGDHALARIHAPTLLIVAGGDPELTQATRSAVRELRCEHRVAVVPGASRSFAEPGVLERAASHALRWFEHHLTHRSYRPPIAEEASVE